MFPARAGMNRLSPSLPGLTRSVPRPRGDEPYARPRASPSNQGSVAEKGEMTPQAKGQCSAEGKGLHRSVHRCPV